MGIKTLNWNISRKKLSLSKIFNKLSSFQVISKNFINDLNIPTLPTFLLHVGVSALQDSPALTQFNSEKLQVLWEMKIIIYTVA